MFESAEILFRKATIRDYEGLSEIYYESDVLHYGFDDFTNKKPVRKARTREFLENYMNGDESDVIVAELTGKIVGFVHCFVRRKEGGYVFNPDTHTYIGDLGVLEQYSGQGIGKGLMEEAEKWSLIRNIKRMVLKADYLNKNAIGLYDKIGYKIDSVEMVKDLTEVAHV